MKNVETTRGKNADANRGSAPRAVTQRREAKHHTPQRAARRPDDAEAFLPDPSGGNNPSRAEDDLAEVLAEEYLGAATSAEEVSEDVRDEVVEDEVGGPFTTTRADEEFAYTVDDMNPEDGQKEPFPQATRIPMKP
jgi:hypothetical protein